ALENAPRGARKSLQQARDLLKSNSHEAKSVSFALSEGVSSMMAPFYDRDKVSQYKLLPLKVERKLALFSAWYEFFPRSTSDEEGRHGTFKDCERILPEIAEMGFDIVYLPPIH